MNDNFKLGLAGLFLVFIVIGGIMFFTRQFSLAITTVDVIKVENGVKCARMVTGDGAAISCWVVPQ